MAKSKKPTYSELEAKVSEFAILLVEAHSRIEKLEAREKLALKRIEEF